MKNSRLELTDSQILLFEKLLAALADLAPSERERRLGKLPPEDQIVAELLRLHFDAPSAFRGLRAGDVLDRYTLVRRLGAGGCGEVWEVDQPLGNSPRRVALKLIRGDRLNGPHGAIYRQRFLEEIGILGKLKASGIARIYSDGQGILPGSDKTASFLIMELVDGQPIHLALASATDKEKALCLAQLADAVQSAHSAGILHKDLKPANVLVEQHGSKPIPKVLDFGLGQWIDAVHPLDPERLGEGTLPYQAPEQLSPRGGGLDVRTDVHALGVMAFQVFTGRLPHDAPDGDAMKLVQCIVTGPRRKLRDVQADLPSSVEKIIAKAMAIEPRNRFATAGKFAEALRDWAEKAANTRPAPKPVSKAKTTIIRATNGGVVAGRDMKDNVIITGNTRTIRL